MSKVHKLQKCQKHTNITMKSENIKKLLQNINKNFINIEIVLK